MNLTICGLRSAVVALNVITSLSVSGILVEEQLHPVKVSASSTYSSRQAVEQLVNGAGINGDLHDSDSGANTMWHSIEKPESTIPAPGLAAVPAWVRFDFAQPTAFDEVQIWNHNQPNLTDRGFRQARLFLSADGLNWTSHVLEIPRGKGSAGQPLSLAVKTDGKPMKSVILAADSNYGGSCYGLSEVRFLLHKEVAENDLPFPTDMRCIPLSYYGRRADGSAGRAVRLNLGDTRLYGKASVEADGEITRFENLTGVNQLSILLQPGMGLTNQCVSQIILRQGQHALKRSVTVPPKRQWTVFIYPHSHVDLGYTEPQEVVEKIHISNMNVGLELARTTAGYPEGARHVWNNEVLWAVESWVKQATPSQMQKFVEAVRNGSIGLSASYANLNTSAASDEELLRFFSYARKIRQLTGVPVDTMCQFDIPGMSWGIVQAAAQNGIRAILDFPNPSDRVGTIHTWRNRHFWWVGPDGKSKVLYLQIFPYNLAWKLGAFNMNPKPYVHVSGRDRFDFANSSLMGTGDIQPGPGLEDFLRGETDDLERAGSPYDIYPIAWSLSDNAMVDAGLPDFVKKWNEKYAYPRLVIASASTIADAFEQRFGPVIPEYRGDLTEYWTDGLGSDARRVGYNRIAKERLIQSETLWTMLRRKDAFPQTEFYDAWRWIQLGTEHTWGYMMPDQPLAKKIEATKASYFENAAREGKKLLAKAVQPIVKPGSDSIAVLNTLSWKRTGLVVLPADESKAGEGVVDEERTPVPSQRLATGELAFLAAEIPALGSRVFKLRRGVAVEESWPVARATGHVLENSLARVTLDPGTGDIISLIDKRSGMEFLKTNSPYALNTFRYLRGGDTPSKATGPTDIVISVKDSGPVIASLLVESRAEGCRRLTREIRLIAGQPQVEIIDTVDKIPTRNKEGVHFAFAFNVPNATTHMDIPWGVMDPLTDQLPGANKNWLAFQRWIDVSNDKAGVTWVGIEAAIVQFGDITANIMGGNGAWKKTFGDTRTIISWALNNHWYTNFPLEQDGVIPFRYAILMHGGYDPAVANRFGLEQHRPLIAVPTGENTRIEQLVALDNPMVFVSTLKPSDDGSAVILRLRSVSDRAETVHLTWPAGQPKSIQWCLADEQPREAAVGAIGLPPQGLATLRLDW